ncbi:sensor histidine kinase [Agromyces humi]|uniref:sensor histidine kinase n=1 Tax=Agromyces humi TaxID=1766800 RepID=UPI00135990AB|nr:GAF domain-containing protein [Agromyces humi]
MPESDLDRALHELVDRAGEVMRAQDRLRALLRATQAVVQQLELRVVLERIVEAAVELVDARYGALGVIAEHGGLEAFIHVGMPPEQVAAIGHLPEGRGVLGALIDDPHPIRLEHITDDPRSVGFPAGHPPMDGFLGVPVRVRDDVYGNLYLTEPRSGEFTRDDEELVAALAGTAGFAIANARLFDETLLRQQWTASSAQIASALLDSDSSTAISLLADELAARSTADRICILLPGIEPLTLRVVEARGLGADRMSGAVVSAMDTVASLSVETGASRAVPGARDSDSSDALAITVGRDPGPVMAVPLKHGNSVWAVIVVSREPGRPPFGPADLDIADDLAGRVGLAIELAEAREQRQRAERTEDRARIARDLHDHVIQQLFGVGLELQALAGESSTPAAERLLGATETIDDAIAQIRTIIFAMRPRGTEDSLRHRILDVVAEASSGLANPVAVGFAGPVDLVLGGPIGGDITAVARELLSNAVRHSEAEQIRVSVTVDATSARVLVEDDGVGIPEQGRRSGLDNLRARAERRGGNLRIDSGPGATTIEWTVPAPGTESNADHDAIGGPR